MVLADAASEITAWFVAIGGFITTLVGAFIILYKSRNEALAKAREAEQIIQSVARKDSLTEWQKIAETWKEQSERRDKVIIQFQEVIQSLVEENAENRMAVHFLYDHLKRFYSIAVKLGAKDIGELPELPPLHDSTQKSVYLIRQALQSAELLKEADKTVPNKPTV